MTKHDREIMEIIEAFDLTGCPHSAVQLAGTDPKTVARYVAIRDAGGDAFVRPARAKIIDPYLEKIEELVERSFGKVRADVVHRCHIVPMGFGGDERTTRRAVAEAKARYDAGHRRTYRPWIPEPGMWAQFDWGAGPSIGGRPTCLFCGWLAWSRFRVVIPTWDKTLASVLSCIDAMLRTFGAAPTYLLTDNERTVSTDHICGLAVRHPHMVAAGRHYLLTELQSVNIQVGSHIGHPPVGPVALIDRHPHVRRARSFERCGCCDGAPGRSPCRHRGPLGAVSDRRSRRGPGRSGVVLVR
jgi:hypothetical protein